MSNKWTSQRQRDLAGAGGMTGGADTGGGGSYEFMADTWWVIRDKVREHKRFRIARSPCAECLPELMVPSEQAGFFERGAGGARTWFDFAC